MQHAMNSLNLTSLFDCAIVFAKEQNLILHDALKGVTDGKAVGTYIERLFKEHLLNAFPDLVTGNSAKDIDLPDPRLNCDIKVSSFHQVQSSCPFKDVRQKIYGLGYNILLFVYEKQDVDDSCQLLFKHVSLIEKEHTADFSLTRMILDMLAAGADKEDLIALFNDKKLPGDELTLATLADEILLNPPLQGYLTISNALQWRLQYSHATSLNIGIPGVRNHEL